MITEFGGFKLGDRVQHVKGGPIGLLVWFDQAWLNKNPNADIFDMGIAWCDLPEAFHPDKGGICVDVQPSNKIVKYKEEGK